jgi:hypothetical protein
VIDPTELAARLAAVQARIARAAEAAGRDPRSVALLAVTKTWPAEVVRAAYDLGLRDFGENYAGELAEKAEALRHLDGLRWHFIGHLQRNKARGVAAVASRCRASTRCASRRPSGAGGGAGAFAGGVGSGERGGRGAEVGVRARGGRGGGGSRWRRSRAYASRG